MKLHSLASTALLALGLTLSLPAAAQSAPVKWIDIELGESYIHRESRNISQIVVSDDTIAELRSLRPGQFQVRAKQVGSTDLWVWYSDDPDHPVNYQLTVHQDLSDLIRRVDQMVPDAPPRVYPLSERLVVEGPVKDVETLERLAQVARIYDENFINLMTVEGDHQVQLQVVFAEVSRTGLRNLGIQGGYTLPHYGSDGLADGVVSMLNLWSPGTTSGHELSRSYIGPYYNATNSTDYTFQAQIPLGSAKIIGMLTALEQSGLTKVLARPTLVALSGQQAEFLAGGEVPLAYATDERVTIDFKDYGIKLVFVPTVLAGDVIDLRVYTEYSEVDTSNQVTVGSVAVPGFLVRKASSHLRLESGMTFAMAGLLSEYTSYSRSAVPLLGEIPLIGALFSHTNHEREERELMIFVTPKLVRPLGPGEVPPPPGTTENNNPNDFELFLMGMDHAAGSRTAEPTGPIGLER